MDGRRSGSGFPVTKVKAGVVLLVAFSGVLVSLQVDAGLTTILGAFVVGLVAGVVLVWLAFPDVDERTAERTRR